MTDEQSRAQFTMWCIMSSPLLISANIGAVGDYALETWGNEEAIYVNQNFRDFPADTPEEQMLYQGIRIFGDELKYDKIVDSGSGMNVWAKPLPDGVWAMVFLNNEDDAKAITCDGDCFAQMYDLDTNISYTVRDLWKHQNVAILTADSDGKFSLTSPDLDPHGGLLMVTITPQK